MLLTGKDGQGVEGLLIVTAQVARCFVERKAAAIVLREDAGADQRARSSRNSVLGSA